jgi:osmotically-inducible protein OsmY
MDSNLAPANTDIDLDLQERVHDAIHTLDVMRGTRAHVEVIVYNGQVTLQGVVQSPMAAAEVAHAAASVFGAGTIISHLVDDATLSRQVAEALANDPRTAAIPPGYEANSVYGHVRLVGHFTADQSQALEAVGRTLPGVRTVSVTAL